MDNILFHVVIFVCSIMFLISYLIVYLQKKRCQNKLNTFIYNKDGSFNSEAGIFLKEVVYRKEPGKRGLETKTILNKEACQLPHS